MHLLDSSFVTPDCYVPDTPDIECPNVQGAQAVYKQELLA